MYHKEPFSVENTSCKFCSFATQEVDGDYRIFFLNSYSGMARTVICEVSDVINFCAYRQALCEHSHTHGRINVQLS